jgi:glutathione S-transferase
LTAYCCASTPSRTDNPLRLLQIPAFLITTLVAGLNYPRAAAGLGALWVFGRVLYTLGYSSGEPAKRTSGAIPSSLALISLLIAATSSAVLMAKESGWKI